MRIFPLRTNRLTAVRSPSSKLDTYSFTFNRSRRARLTPTLFPDFKDAMKALELLYKENYEKNITDLCTEVSKAVGDSQHKKAWDLINRLTGRKSRSAAVIKAENKGDRIQKLHTYFKDIYDKEVPPNSNNPAITPIFNAPPFYNTRPITIEEVKLAIRSLQNGKSCGIDEIPSEILKLPSLESKILSILNQAYSSKTVPEEWLISIVVPVPKKGDLSFCKNYRGIALMSTCAKLYDKIILKRLQVTLDKCLRYNQNGFRPLRSTAQHVITLRHILEMCDVHQDKKLISIFIDFSSAFYSVNWEAMESILLRGFLPPLNLYQPLCHFIVDQK